MADERQRFITGRDAGSRGVELLAGLNCALTLALSEPLSPLLITVATKQVFNNVSPILRPALGSRAFDELARSGSCGTPHPISLLTNVTARRHYGWNGPALLLYPSDSMLDLIGGWEGVTAEVVIPWTDDQASRWTKAWRPTAIGSAGPIAAPEELDPAVAAGLRELTEFVNPINRLLTRDDRDRAVVVMETIAHFAPSVAPEALRAHLVGTLAWEGETATTAESILRDVQRGKRIRGRQGPDQISWARWQQSR